VARTRLLSKVSGPKYGGPFQTIAGIARHEGLGGLYCGCLPALIGMAPAGAVFYGLFDLLKHRHLEELAALGAANHLHLEPQWTLIYGAMAGLASELIVYPLEVVRRKIQVQSMASVAARSAMMRHPTTVAAGAAAAAVALGGCPIAASSGLKRVFLTCKEILKAEGPMGFYTGMAPNLAQVFPSAALSYYTYDRLKQMLQVA